MRILLTGGAGFIGNHVALELIARGYYPVIVDNFNDYYDPALKEARVKRLPEGKCEVHRLDLSDFAGIEKLFKAHGFEKVCHLAAQAGVRYSLTHPFVYENANMLGTLNILELCRHNGVKRLVYASSSSVYGKNTKLPFSEDDRVDNPISLYAATKKANELYAHTYSHLYGLETVGLRFFTVYGPWGRPDMAAYLFADAIMAGRPIKVFNHGKMRRDFTYIDDIVSGIVASIKEPLPTHCEVFNLGNHRSVELMRYIGLIEDYLGKKARMEMLPLQAGDVPETYADIDKARKYLGFEPKTPVEEGLRWFIEWFRGYGGHCS